MSVWYPAAMTEQKVHYKTDSMYLTACRRRLLFEETTSARKDKVTCPQCKSILKGRA